MPNDPGLSPDTCLFVEAVSGDGGAHNGNGVWWLSPDVSLTGACLDNTLAVTATDVSGSVSSGSLKSGALGSSVNNSGSCAFPRKLACCPGVIDPSLITCG